MNIRNLKSKLIVTVAVAGFTAVLYIFKIPCLFLTFTGIKCLGCGMTRALLSALKFDISAAFNFHIMFWSVPVLYVCFLKDGRLFRSRSFNKIFYILMAAGFMINWLRGIIL